MKMREFFVGQAGEFDILWKSQMFMGAILLLIGIAIFVFPAILALLVAIGIIMAGISMIASAWRLRRLQRQNHGVSSTDMFEW